MKRWWHYLLQYRFGYWTRVLLLCGAGFLLLAVPWGRNLSWDWSKTQRHALTTSTQRLLASVHDPIDIKVFLSKTATHSSRPPMSDVELKQQLRRFFARWLGYKSNMRLEFIHHAQDPQLIERYGLKGLHEVVLIYRGRHQRLLRLDDTAVTNALMQLLHERETWVVFLEGHGEKSLHSTAPNGLAGLAEELRRRHVHLQSLNLLNTPVIPRNTGLLVVAGTQALAKNEVAVLHTYLAQGGNLLWLHDPGFSRGLESIGDFLGVEILPGLLLQPRLDQENPAVITLTIKEQPHLITHGLNNFSVQLPVAAALRITPRPEFQSETLLSTDNTSWTETELNNPHRHKFTPNSADRLGPHAVAVLLQRPRPQSKPTAWQRVLVVGDSDFLSNRYLDQGANRLLAMNLFDWLNGQEDLISAQTPPLADVVLNLTAQQLVWVGLILGLGLPGLLVVWGSLSLWSRTRRATH